MPPKSKRQARFLGAIAGGRIKGGTRGRPTKKQARESLRGSKVKRLPEKAKPKRSRRRRKR